MELFRKGVKGNEYIDNDTFKINKISIEYFFFFFFVFKIKNINVHIITYF